jgi:acyl transferase domain-containing protein
LQPDLLDSFGGQLQVHSAKDPAKLNSHKNRPNFVGTTSFGIGGTNGALILMEGPGNRLKSRQIPIGIGKMPSPPLFNVPMAYQFFPVSAASVNSLKAFASKLAMFVRVRQFILFSANFYLLGKMAFRPKDLYL